MKFRDPKVNIKQQKVGPCNWMKVPPVRDSKVRRKEDQGLNLGQYVCLGRLLHMSRGRERKPRRIYQRKRRRPSCRMEGAKKRGVGSGCLTLPGGRAQETKRCHWIWPLRGDEWWQESHFSREARWDGRRVAAGKGNGQAQSSLALERGDVWASSFGERQGLWKAELGRVARQRRHCLWSRGWAGRPSVLDPSSGLGRVPKCVLRLPQVWPRGRPHGWARAWGASRHRARPGSQVPRNRPPVRGPTCNRYQAAPRVTGGSQGLELGAPIAPLAAAPAAPDVQAAQFRFGLNRGDSRAPALATESLEPQHHLLRRPVHLSPGVSRGWHGLESVKPWLGDILSNTARDAVFPWSFHGVRCRDTKKVRRGAWFTFEPSVYTVRLELRIVEGTRTGLVRCFPRCLLKT